jgi:hypothetical protein
MLAILAGLRTWIMVMGTLIGVNQASVSGSATLNEWSPAIVTRGGNSNVLYVLWESQSCTLRDCIRLELSDNGGQSFRSVTVPPVTQVQGANEPPISQVVFANPSDGYAVEYASTGRTWRTSALFATVNGGRSWRSVEIAPHTQILDLTAASNLFYATTVQCRAKPTKCTNARLNRSPTSAAKWSDLSLPRSLKKYWLGSIAVAAYGRTVWLTTQDQTSTPYSPFLATSDNEGRSWTVRVQPDLSSVNNCWLLPVSTQVLWATCDQGNQQGDIVYSSDGGSRWEEESGGLLGQFGFGTFDPVTSSVAYLINEWHTPNLYRVTSESSTPQFAGSLPAGLFWWSLSFTNARQGVALSQGRGGGLPNLMWRTEDGGNRWTLIKP